MKGFIIQDVRQWTLTKFYQWRNPDNCYVAPHVFRQEEVNLIKELSVEWEIKPAYLIEAEYTKEKGVKFLSYPKVFLE